MEQSADLAADTLVLVDDGRPPAAVVPVPVTTARPGDPRLSVPPLPPRLVSRSRLLHALDRAVASSALTLVSAPPGGGKTVLLSEWARRRGLPTAWLALTRADDDPLRFWTLFVAATRSPSRESFPSVWTPGAVPGLLDALFGEEPEGTPPVVVVLDDAHVLTHPDVTEGLDRIVRRWSHRVRLVLGTRSVPLLPMHQYRLAGLLHELRGSDLAMGPDETAELLAAHGITLDERAIQLLADRTEGWTAGLRLAALRMEVAERPADVVLQLAMDNGSIGEYLVQEVLSVLPEHVRRLLVQTSFLDEVTGGAAAAITGVQGCEEILADLARTNSFVIPLDSACTRFRYHQLFREVLRYLARRETGLSSQEAHRRATAWFSSRRDVRSAIQWALRGGDLALARSVLVRGGLAHAFVTRQELGDLRLDGLLRPPSDPVRGPDHPGPDDAEELAVARLAVAAVRAGRTPEGPDDVRAARPGPDPADPDLRLTQHLAQLRLAMAAGAYADVERTVAVLTGDDQRERVDAVPGLRSSLLLTLARVRFSAGRLAEVAPTLERALAEAEREGPPAVQLDVLALQAMASASGGRSRHTDLALARAGDLLALHPELTPPVLLDLAVARRAYVAADVDTMATAMRRVTTAGPLHADAAVAASVAFLQAMLLAASGLPVEARSWLRAPVLEAGGVGMLTVYRDCELASLDLAAGLPHAAAALLEPYLGGPYRVTVAVHAARARLALGDVDGADRLVRPVLAEASPQVDRYGVVAALLCQAQIALARGDDARALECVDRALTLAAPDIVMPFVRHADAFADLLRRHPEAAPAWPAAASVLTAAPVALPAAPPAPRAPVESLPDPLTDRETAVLRLLTTAMSTTELADELVLSVNTVKTHLAAIYRKLGVSRRRDAIRRARELEML